MLRRWWVDGELHFRNCFNHQSWPPLLLPCCSSRYLDSKLECLDHESPEILTKVWAVFCLASSIWRAIHHIDSLAYMPQLSANTATAGQSSSDSLLYLHFHFHSLQRRHEYYLIARRGASLGWYRPPHVWSLTRRCLPPKFDEDYLRQKHQHPHRHLKMDSQIRKGMVYLIGVADGRWWIAGWSLSATIIINNWELYFPIFGFIIAALDLGHLSFQSHLLLLRDSEIFHGQF